MVLCIDIGGTSVRIGVSENGASFEKIDKFNTPQEFDELINLVASAVQNREKIEQISFGVAGVVNHDNGGLVWMPQRLNWNGQNVFEKLKTLFPNSQMKIENDANLATLGEAVYGTGKNYSIVSYLTLSTGIGGGLCIDKKIVSTKNGFEPGHQIINPNGEMWKCGQKGCFESEASGTAFQKRFGVRGEDCRDEKIWKEYAKLLAPGINNVLAMWSPEILVLGGGVSTYFDFFSEPLLQELKPLVTFSDLPEIKKAELDEPGLYGGLALFNI